MNRQGGRWTRAANIQLATTCSVLPPSPALPSPSPHPCKKCHAALMEKARACLSSSRETPMPYSWQAHAPGCAVPGGAWQSHRRRERCSQYFIIAFCFIIFLPRSISPAPPTPTTRLSRAPSFFIERGTVAGTGSAGFDLRGCTTSAPSGQPTPPANANPVSPMDLVLAQSLQRYGEAILTPHGWVHQGLNQLGRTCCPSMGSAVTTRPEFAGSMLGVLRASVCVAVCSHIRSPHVPAVASSISYFAPTSRPSPAREADTFFSSARLCPALPPPPRGYLSSPLRDVLR